MKFYEDNTPIPTQLEIIIQLPLVMFKKCIKMSTNMVDICTEQKTGLAVICTVKKKKQFCQVCTLILFSTEFSLPLNKKT